MLPLLLLALGCDDERKRPVPDAGQAAEPVASSEPAPSDAPAESATEAAPARPAPLRCPQEMLAITDDEGIGRYCIDRWEASLMDRQSGQALSPYYPPRAKAAMKIREIWERKRFQMGGPLAQAMAVPPVPLHQQSAEPEIVAMSKPGVTPNGYLSAVDAETACRNAGKRLCTADEWVRACKGKQQQKFPYGSTYKAGACNVFRATHPAAELHDDASEGHLDPRLNMVRDREGQLLRKTGDTPLCASEWDDGAAFDMNGNLDEWVDDPSGRFLGGFYARAQKNGCQSSVSSHGRTYFDYSTGTRCCASPQ